MAALAPATSRGGAWGIALPGQNGAAARPAALRSFTLRRRSAAKKAMSVVKAQGGPEVFGAPMEMDGTQKAMAGLPEPALYGAAALLVAGLGGIGATVGGKAPDSIKTLGQAAGLLAGAGAGAAVVVKANEKRQKAAGIELQNVLATEGFDPANLTAATVAEVGNKFGVKDMTETLGEELKGLYDAYIRSVLPPGEPMTGDEAEKLRNFIDAIGLSDEQAAEVHLDAGRRIQRLRFEASTRSSEADERRAFQKLIYVSTMVFGDRQAAFLLPWKRLFNITDAQLYVAKRDNAKQLFSDSLKSMGGVLPSDRELLKELKVKMETFKLSDDVAAELIAEAARAFAEAETDKAIECVKRRTRVKDYSDTMTAVAEIVAYNRALTGMSGDEELVPGLGPVTLLGGKFEEAGSSNDLREVMKVFLEEKLRMDNSFTDATEADFNDLRTIFGLGPKEVSQIRDDVVVRIYRNKLREKVTSGDLEAAESKAEVLGELCDSLKFDPASAANLHSSLYRQKLSTVLEKKSITDEDEEELQKMCRLLCLQKADVAAVHKELCGGIVRSAIEDALSAGYEAFSSDDRDNVKKAIADTRLEEAVVKEILDSTARRAFLVYTTKARNQNNRLESAKELKKLTYFNTMVVAPLLDDIKSEETKEKEAKAAKEMEELMAQAKKMEEDRKKEAAGEKVEEGETEGEEKKEAEEEEKKEAEDVQPSTLAKTQSGEDEVAVVKSQKEITLAEDLDKRDRLDIYKNFLLYCMQGDVVTLPMGGTMVVERDQSEFQRLGQLGDVLGLNQLDVMEVHTGLAEQAFRNQVQQVLADGVLTNEKTEFLKDMQTKMGLTDEKAQKVIKGVQNEKLIAGLNASSRAGTMSTEKVMELLDSGVDVTSIISADKRATLFRQKVEDSLTDGTGNFSAEDMLQDLPEKLGLEEKKVKEIIKEVAGNRARSTLVQAISYLRQKKLDAAVKDINNLVACNRANPSDKALEWSAPEEIMDMFSVYMIKEKDEGKQQEVQKLLGISDDEAKSLKDVVESGGFTLEQEAAEEEKSFF